MKYACLAFLVAAAGCTKPNPLDCQDDHFCSDSAHPFCDESGSVGGTPGVCVAVDCTPGTFLECSGDSALTCTDAGNNYEPLSCQTGCGANGCNIASCPIGTTTMCSGASLVSCDGQGHVTSTVACALGCNDPAKRCNKLNPSNGLAGSLDDAANASDLILSGPATIDTDLGTVTDASGSRTVSSAALSVGLPVGLFIIKTKSFKTGGNVTVVGTRALAIVSAGVVRIDHIVSVSARTQVNGPGAMTTDTSCLGGGTPPGNAKGHAGAGGGGFGTAGGRGGTGGIPVIQGGSAGGVSGTTELVPLRGGCPGTREATSDGDYTAGGGGGAIQIVSGEKIEVADGGFVAANGSGGGKFKGINNVCEIGTPCDHGDSGGAGGGILLEAPLVTVSSLGGIVANGGGGGCNVNGAGAPGDLTATPAAGSICAQDGSKGGDGGAGASTGQNGGNGTGTSPVGGGGGGGAGRVRVNIAAGAQFSPAGVVSGVKTTGDLGVR